MECLGYLVSYLCGTSSDGRRQAPFDDAREVAATPSGFLQSKACPFGPAFAKVWEETKRQREPRESATATPTSTFAEENSESKAEEEEAAPDEETADTFSNFLAEAKDLSVEESEPEEAAPDEETADTFSNFLAEAKDLSVEESEPEEAAPDEETADTFSNFLAEAKDLSVEESEPEEAAPDEETADTFSNFLAEAKDLSVEESEPEEVCATPPTPPRILAAGRRMWCEDMTPPKPVGGVVADFVAKMGFGQFGDISNVKAATIQAGEAGTLVLLHIYDVSQDSAIQRVNQVFASQYSPIKFGGIFHAAVEVSGTEYWYGYSPSRTIPGICSNPPKLHPLHRYKETVKMGYTKCSAAQVAEILADLSEEHPAHEYDLWRRNCCHVADEFTRRLGIGSIPGWVNRWANLGAAVGFGRAS